jgi:hypothetical protein
LICVSVTALQTHTYMERSPDWVVMNNDNNSHLKIPAGEKKLCAVGPESSIRG